MSIIEVIVITLAYLGDAVYELYVREYLIKKSPIKVNELQAKSKKYITAKSQALIVNNLLEESFFNENEKDIIYRGRNYKRNMHPKNTDIVTYKWATGLEAVIGYLYLTSKERLNLLMIKILKEEE